MSNRPQTSLATPTSDSANTLRTFIIGVGLFLLGGTIWLLIADTWSASQVHNQCFDTTELCCNHLDEDRQKAKQIGTLISLYWSQLRDDEPANAQNFYDLFARGGVLSSIYGNYYGSTNIQNAMVELFDAWAGIYNSITIEGFFWDAETRTLTMYWIWWGVYEGPYSIDIYIVIRFDCDFRIVYYRPYWDTQQILSTFVNTTERACSTCRHGREDNHHHHRPFEHHHHHRPRPTSAPTPAPIIVR